MQTRVEITGTSRTSVRPEGPHHTCFASRKRGFTLAELLAVMLIMVILMGMAVNAFYGMGRGARMRGAVASFNTALSLTRQYAITRSEPLTIELIESEETGETVWSYNILREDEGQSEEERRLRPTQYLPPGISFDTTDLRFTFLADGSLDGHRNVVIDVVDEHGHAITFTIYGLTGMVNIKEPE